jgi:putative flippase GtrA
MILAYHQFPETLRMMLTAILGAGIGWITYEIIYWLIPAFSCRATASWVLAFTIGVVRQHALHRTLTFIEHTPYLSSLGRAYIFYAMATFCGAFLNYTLTVHLEVHHRMAWLACLLLTGLLSFFFLKRMVFNGGKSS